MPFWDLVCYGVTPGAYGVPQFNEAPPDAAFGLGLSPVVFLYATWIGFIARWLWTQLLAQVPRPTASFQGKTVIIIGANQGLGFEASEHIVELGAAKLIMAVRSTEKGEAAKSSIEKTTDCGPGVIEVWPFDLCSYASVKAFAERAARELKRVDVLLENAGVNWFHWDRAEDNEMNLTVNVVSTFLLAFLMLPKLEETAARLPGSATTYVLGRSAEAGSRMLVDGASGGADTHGQYLEMCRVTRPAITVVEPDGPHTQKRVWDELMAKPDIIEPGISGNL